MDSGFDKTAWSALRYVLVVPAFNEQDAISGLLRRVLAAREQVLAKTPVTEMVVVVVNDGSSDRTQEIIDQPEFAEVVKVRFRENRGYGAAIKAGFAAAPGELVGFIDADGTCDPEFSVQLINHLLATGADMVLASRLNADSRMPLVRRIGNRGFSWLLNVLAGHCGRGYRVGISSAAAVEPAVDVAVARRHAFHARVKLHLCPGSPAADRRGADAV